MIEIFNRNTMLSRYIKQLLRNTRIPHRKILFDGDTMYSGCEYHYRGRSLKCTSTGRFTLSDSDHNYFGKLTVHDDLEVSDSLQIKRYSDNCVKFEEEEIVTQPLTVTDDVVSLDLYKRATFQLLSRYNEERDWMCHGSNYQPTSPFYDSDTHYHLGEYLRLLKNDYNLNLMPLYNCFHNVTTQQFHIDNFRELQNYTNNKYKVYIVPIKFGIPYTVLIDSSHPITVKPVFYREKLLTDSSGLKLLANQLPLGLTVRYNQTQHLDPFIFKVDPSALPLKTYQKLHCLERYLCLCIQVRSTVDAKPVVLEGDFTKNVDRVISDPSFLDDKYTDTQRINNSLVSKLSLISNYDGKYVPFADRLLDYLLNNTIDSREIVPQNIVKIRNQLNCHENFEAAWDERLRFEIYNNYTKGYEKKAYLTGFDVLGYVDSEVEKFLNRR